MSNINEVVDLSDLEPHQIQLLIDELNKLDKDTRSKIEYVIQQGFTELEALQYVINNSPYLWAKVYLNWEGRDYQKDILMHGKKSKKLVLRLGRRLGKCLPGYVRIPDPETGIEVTIEELYKRQTANVHTMNTNLKIAHTSTNMVWDNGIKPVFKVMTNTGKEIDATGNHPLYTINGWVDIDNLKVGDYVATPRKLSINNYTDLETWKIIFIAYMLGDGNCVNNNCRFSNLIGKVTDEMKCILNNHLECDLKKYEYNSECDYNIINTGKHKDNYARNLLKEYGIWDKYSTEKTIPKEIFMLDNNKLSIFFSRLYATDGWATGSKPNEKKRIEIGYATSCKEFAYNIQHLLLRFGIHSIVTKKKIKYNGGINISYTVGIYSVNDILNFIENIGIYGKEEAILKVKNVALSINEKEDIVPIEILEYVESERVNKNITKKEMIPEYLGSNGRYRNRYAPQRKLLIHYANTLQDEKINDLANSDIYWEKITSINYVGDLQTYDLTIPDTHNFIANDFITHNTECMCVLILWHAFTQVNKGTEDKYDVLIVTPFDTQIELIFKRLHELIDGSPLLRGEVERDIHHKIRLKNKSTISGLTAGAKAGNGAANVRGQGCDILILDEIDYMGSTEIVNVMNIRNEAPDRIKVIASSTPCGKHEEFYKWCVGASRRYSVSQESIDNFNFDKYQEGLNSKGNGWTEFYAPSTVNKELLKINIDTEQTYFEDLKGEFTQMKFCQEVMAEFGEDSFGVYQKKFIESATELGRLHKHRYTTDMTDSELEIYLDMHRGDIKILGVDWDKYGASTNMACVTLDKFCRNEDGTISPLFKVLFRVEIPRGDFTYTEAVNKIIELNDIYNFEWIGIDRGYGRLQIDILFEMLYSVIIITNNEKSDNNGKFSRVA